MPDRAPARRRRAAPRQGPAPAFARQLSSPGYVLDARPARAGPARERARAPVAPADRPSPCVLLVSRARDAELDAVAGLLRRVGVPTARLNADELSGVDLLADPRSRAVWLDGRWLSPTVTWIRHFCAEAIPGGGGPAQDMFLRLSWQALASQLSVFSRASVAARPVGIMEQLLLARRHRIAVPRTVVATDPGQAREVLRSERVVVKSAHRHFVEAAPGALTGVFPLVLPRGRLGGAPCPGPPLIVQEYVEHDRELRVYYAAGRVLSFEVGKRSPADPWLAPDRIRIRQVDPPPAAASAATLLAHALSLRFGAFDFLLRGGVPVFLEANPDGDWRWLEARLGAGPVTGAAARMLRDLHREAALGTGRRGGGSFDLLAFLARDPPP